MQIFRNIWKRYRYCFHTLRHTYATLLLEKGVRIEYISKALGHAQLETTQIYAHISDTALNEKIDVALSSIPVNFAQDFTDLDKEFRPPQKINPIELLKVRFVNGEIDRDTYRTMLEELNPMQADHGKSTDWNTRNY